jgi:hypothetical protein
MVLESPFFLKELRILGRRNFAPLAGLLLLECGLLLLPLLAMEWLVSQGLGEEPLFQRMVLTFLGLFHAGVCAAGGSKMGDRVFREECRQGTLESLRLVSLEPWRLVVQKALFPLYGLGVLWIAGLPFYMAIAVRGHFLPRELEMGAVLAGLAGVVQFGATLLKPPQGAAAVGAGDWRPGAERIAASAAGLALPCLLMALLVLMCGDWVAAAVRDRTSPFRMVPFYGAILRSDHLLAVVLLIFLVPVSGAALNTASPASRWTREAAYGGSLLALGMAYYLVVGYLWSALSPGARAAWVAGLPAVGLLCAILPVSSRKKDVRIEDPLARWEVAWISRWWDNAVFVRDLRAGLRTAGLTRQSWRTLLQLLLFPVVMASITLLPVVGAPFGAIFASRGPFCAELVSRSAVMAAFFGPIYAFGAFGSLGGRAQISWGKERQLDTLTQLLGTPLCSEALVRGRWAASALAALPALCACLILLVLSLGFASERIGLGEYLALEACVASVGLLVAADAAAIGPKGDWCFGLIGLAVFFLELLLALVLAFSFIHLRTTALFPVLMTTGLILVPINMALTCFLYRRSVMEVERLRTGDTP